MEDSEQARRALPEDLLLTTSMLVRLGNCPLRSRQTFGFLCWWSSSYSRGRGRGAVLRQA